MLNSNKTYVFSKSHVMLTIITFLSCCLQFNILVFCCILMDWDGVGWVSEKKNHQHAPFCELLILMILLLKVGWDLKQVN